MAGVRVSVFDVGFSARELRDLEPLPIRFDKRIYDSCRAIDPSPRGEYEVTDAAQHAVDKGVEFTGVKEALAVLDLTSRTDIGPVTELLAGHKVDF